jgi:hypothetical protein
MNDSEISLLASCINADPFTEEQAEFLQKWCMITTDEQVAEFNDLLPSNFNITSRQTNDDRTVIPVALLTDVNLYSAIIDDLQELEKIELTPQDFSDWVEPTESVDNSYPVLTDELKAELEAAGAIFEE